MAEFLDTKDRTDLLNRLKRAEGQLRGVQRMIEEGHTCIDIAGQMAAARKALDSTYSRMTVVFVEHELKHRLNFPEERQADLSAVLEEMQALLAKLR
jgi:CsoR family transcriptional regulator, copper-sensing transcriptional repressor